MGSNLAGKYCMIMTERKRYDGGCFETVSEVAHLFEFSVSDLMKTNRCIALLHDGDALECLRTSVRPAALPACTLTKIFFVELTGIFFAWMAVLSECTPSEKDIRQTYMYHDSPVMNNNFSLRD